MEERNVIPDRKPALPKHPHMIITILTVGTKIALVKVANILIALAADHKAGEVGVVRGRHDDLWHEDFFDGSHADTTDYAVALRLTKVCFL